MDCYEIIVWDNQSDDNTAKIVRKYASDKIHYHYAPRRTDLGEARNLAVKVAQFEWIAFLDCDDIWEKNKLEKQFSLLLKHTRPEEVGLIYGRMKIFRSDGCQIASKWDKPDLPDGNIFNELLIEDFIPLLSAVFRKEAFAQSGGIPKFYKASEDYYLFLGISKKWEVLALQEFCCYYRWHEANLSHRYRRRTQFENAVLKFKYDKNVHIFRFLSNLIVLFLRANFPFGMMLLLFRRKRQFAIWGTGKLGIETLGYFSKREISTDVFLDTYTKTENSEISNVPIIPSDRYEKKKYFVVVSSMYYQEITNSMKERGAHPFLDYLIFY